jgi:hypothetical protein
VVDGLFCEDRLAGLRFAEIQLDADQVAAVQSTVRRPVLAAYRRCGWLDAAAAQDMGQRGHGGAFSIDASVRLEGNDRQALERPLRYCARPCWASEGLLEAGDGEHLVYLLPKPGVDRAT